MAPTRVRKGAPVAPFSSGVAVTKSDATVFEPTRGLYTGSGGDLSVVFADGGAAVTLKSSPAGTVLNISVVQVMAATVPADTVALY